MRGRPHIPPGEEVEIALVTENERVRGTLRLPDMRDAGRARFVEEMPIDVSPARLERIPIVLLDDATRGTPACLLDSFATSTSFAFPLPAPFPARLLVNRVIVGTDDPDQRYPAATVRCRPLLDFFDSSALTPARVASEGGGREQRAEAIVGDSTYTLGEIASMRIDATTASLDWSADLTIAGPARTLPEWVEKLLGALHLFALFADRAMAPDQLCGETGGGRVDMYCSWQQPAAPEATVPLATLRSVGVRLPALLHAWERLLQDAPDLVNHLDRFQQFRERDNQADQVLTLARCLELLHDFGDRFESVLRSKDDHKRLVDGLLSAMPEHMRAEHGPWIREALLQANRKRLVVQIQDIMSSLGPEVVAACHIDDSAAFASLTKRARNHLTHPTGPAPGDLPDGRDLVVMINRMWFVVRAAVLLELGCSSAEIVSALLRSSRKHYLLD